LSSSIARSFPRGSCERRERAWEGANGGSAMVTYPSGFPAHDARPTIRSSGHGRHQVVTIFDRFGPVDAIDVALLAALLYQGYLLLLGSRAWNVLRGLAALGVLWLLASSFGLQGTKWVFDRLAPVGILALVIVFQPELRAALERMGRGRSQRAVAGDPVQEIMEVVRELAARHVGALIAIERGTPLGEYGQQGTLLRTPVRSEVLETLFDSRGPLHDGGVIVRGDEIVWAGAIFPLSERQEGWEAQLGTRHRAALGLSEASDALVVVVSEERGTVSLARDGRLSTDVAPSDLVKALRDAYVEAPR
jgi:diadenylate cyclase